MISLSVFAQNKPMVQVTVEKGDCLIRICNKYLENPSQWRTIAQVNKLKNPDIILPKQVLLFPAEMMKGTPVAGKVTFLQGSAEIKPQGSQEWIPLVSGDEVKEGSMVRTGDKSSVEIKFADGNTFLLKQNTTIGLKTARKSSDTYSKYKMSLSTGKLISNVQKTVDRESAVQIEDPTAVLGVRGTIFRSYVLPDGTSQFEVIEGTVVVEGEKETVEVKEGEGTIVHKKAPPISPRKLLHPPVLISTLDTVYKKFPVLLSFAEVEGAISYRVILAKDNEVKNVVQETVIKPQDIFEIKDMEDGTYFMQSSSIDSLGLEGLPSKTVKINIRINPAAPFVEIPAVGAEYKSGNLKCKWLNVKDAKKYHIQIAEDAEFKKLVVQDDNIVNPEYVTGNLEYKQYYFRVSSIASDGYQGEWSDTFTFTLIPPPASPPVETPEMDKNSIKIRWKNLGEDITYRVQVSRNENFDRVIIDRKVDIPEIIFEKPKQVGIYYVRVSGIDSASREGLFSKPQSFIILPAVSIVEKPVVERKKIKVRWENLGEDITYRVQVSRNENFDKVIIDRKVDIPEIIFEKPKQVGIYYVRVSGIDSANREGLFSKPQSFEIKRNYLPIFGIGGAAGILLLLTL